MKHNSAKQKYIEYLISGDKNFVAYDNGDFILTDGPRFMEAKEKEKKKSCKIDTCVPGFRNTKTITIDHGDRYYGYERQEDGTCAKKNYDCDNGNLVPF
jgi:hypothetical protein